MSDTVTVTKEAQTDCTHVNYVSTFTGADGPLRYCHTCGALEDPAGGGEWIRCAQAAFQRLPAEIAGRTETVQIDPRVAEVVSAAIALREGLQGRMRPAPGTQDRLWNALDSLPTLEAETRVDYPTVAELLDVLRRIAKYSTDPLVAADAATAVRQVERRSDSPKGGGT